MATSSPVLTVMLISCKVPLSSVSVELILTLDLGDWLPLPFSLSMLMIAVTSCVPCEEERRESKRVRDERVSDERVRNERVRD